ncbi:1-phosphatidylinositol 4,5-bisphosphate phosphodiesterase gamma-1-like [Acropora palmata]|uniref:1-phosphatidylinositol 4,5-bisphosphate phosphodiesterase gamma-1-like n=1 Tax=Acropora palmata TaxID=6131 RepID=UPI003DA143E7
MSAKENVYGPGPGNASGIAIGEEMGPIITALKEGSAMTRYYSNRKRQSDVRIFKLKMEEFQLVWCRKEGAREEDSVFIREIKEVRRGLGSKDFDRNADAARRRDPNRCLVILYGTEFKLKTLSLVAHSHQEREFWVKGLVYLMYESLIATQAVLIHRWLLREWNGIAALANTARKGPSSIEMPILIGMRELRAFFQRVNVKLSNAKLKELIQIAGRGDSHVNFEGFRKIYDSIMTVKELVVQFSDYIENGTYVPLVNFQRFLLEEQEEPGAKDLETVRSYMLEYLSDGSRNYSEPYFTVSEFLDYLMSKGNSAFNSAHCEVYQDMTKPLTFYWIASSHNTYLTGDQFQGESSVEAYIRALRMGCRCLELDCWDGPDGLPIITHGHTLVSRIKFVEVVRAIKDNAFVASDYPLILSLENHCSIPQQKVMAQTFQDIFGDCLLSQPIDGNAKEMPSPTALRNKIILKHKKLPKDQTQAAETTVGDPLVEDDLSQSLKNGYLLLEDEIDHGWKRHFFCLTKDKLFWTEEQVRSEEDDDDEGLEGAGAGESSKDELHYGERWFHGKLLDGRKVSENLLNQFNRGDGSFLVRESTTFVGDFSLSFWRRGKVQHCRIKSKQENGQTKYYLVDQVTFDSLYSLINFYQSHPLKSMNFELTLADAIPQPNAHLDQCWYHDNLNRDKAEDMLKRVRKNGAYLVRRKETEQATDGSESNRDVFDTQDDKSSYAISFRAEGKIKHCRIKREGRLFTIGTAQFESLVELVEFYRKHPLYKGMKLRYPINESVLSKVGQCPEEDAIYGSGDHYHEPNQFITKPACRALWDYEAQNPDEMSFCRGAFITNVTKEDGGWWLGDYGGQRQKFFPANYCEEINYVAEEEAKNNKYENGVDEESEAPTQEMSPLGDLQKGSIDLQGCIVETGPPKAGQRYIFRISRREILLEASAESQEDLNDWLQVLRQMANEREAVVQKMVRQANLSQELSDLVVYCQPVPFDLDNVSGKHHEMSSFPETRLERFISKRNSKEFMKYHRKQFSRVYPRGSRIDSSNYDPITMWNHGVQLCALNYQTPDRAMQMNHGKFLDNGRCGYVLQPECLRHDSFEIYKRDAAGLAGVEPLTLTLTIIAARHLNKSGRGIASPFVEVEIVGAPYDNTKFKTETKADNGLNPVWWVKFDVDVINPPLAYLRFVVNDEDMFGEPNFIGHAIFPMNSLKTGYRSVPLKNAYSEEFELSCLLVHIDIRSAMGGDENLYASIQVLRDRVEEISHDMENKEKRARMTMCSLLSQQNGPQSQEFSQFQDAHKHQMESLGKQLRQQQDNLRQLQRERAAKSSTRGSPAKSNKYM